MRYRIVALIGLAVASVGCTKDLSNPDRFSSTGIFNLSGTKIGDMRTLYVGAGQSNMASENLSDSFPKNINVAVGGTSENLWAEGQPLYNNMVAALKKGNGNAALLYWQGESEGLYNGPDPWANNFTSMIAAMRRDVGYQVHVVFVQIGQTTLEGSDRSYWAMIQAQQASVSIPGVVMISAKDMFPEGDNQIHYSQAQYHIMQQRMIAALATIH